MDDPALPTIELGGITVWDARKWFPYKGDTGLVAFRPRTKDQVEEVAIHHDAVAFSGLDLDFNGSTVDEERDRMQASYNWHTKHWPGPNAPEGWNWPGMGYHLYCFPSGRIYLVGGLNTIRAHVAYRNTRGIGVVGAGDFTQRPPQGLHVVAYGQAVAWSWLWRSQQLPVDGHRVWAAKNPPEIRAEWATSCPGNTYASWIPDVQRVAHQAYKVATQEEDLMNYKVARQWGPAMTFLMAWLPVNDGADIPIWKRHILTAVSVTRIVDTYGSPETFTPAELQNIPTIS